MNKKRYFTRDEANNLIPWLMDKIQKMQELQADIRNLYTDIDYIKGKSRSNGSKAIDGNIDDKTRQIQIKEATLSSEVGEINREGIELRDIAKGLVDFLSILDGKEIYLCWIHGEQEIKFWHETNTGFSGRQPL